MKLKWSQRKAAAARARLGERNELVLEVLAFRHQLSGGTELGPAAPVSVSDGDLSDQTEIAIATISIAVRRPRMVKVATTQATEVRVGRSSETHVRDPQLLNR